MDVWTRKRKILHHPRQWRRYRTICKPELEEHHFILMETLLALLFAQDILAILAWVLHSIYDDRVLGKSRRRQYWIWISNLCSFKSDFSNSSCALFVVGILHRILWDEKRIESLLYESLNRLRFLFNGDHPLLLDKNGSSLSRPCWDQSRRIASASHHDCLGYFYPIIGDAQLPEGVWLLGNICPIAGANHYFSLTVGCMSRFICLVAVIDVLCSARQ